MKHLDFASGDKERSAFPATCEVQLRVVARPDRLVSKRLGRLALELPTVPKMVQNAVEKNAS